MKWFYFRIEKVFGAAALLAALFSEASAQVGISGEIAMASDYRFRGISSSNGKPVAMAGVEAQSGLGWYGGVWASTLGNDNPAGSNEIDLYGGWSGNLTDRTVIDINLVYYHFPQRTEGSPDDWDNFELSASASFALEDVTIATVGAAYVWPQSALDNKSNTYVFAGIEHDFSAGWRANAHLGYTDGSYSPSEGGSNMDWSVGAYFQWLPATWVGLEYIGANIDSLDSSELETLVVSLRREF